MKKSKAVLTEDDVREFVRLEMNSNGLSLRGYANKTGVRLSTLCDFLMGRPVGKKLFGKLGFETRYVRA